jgi:hypothetical protein
MIMTVMYPCHQLGVYQPPLSITLKHMWLVLRLSLIIQNQTQDFQPEMFPRLESIVNDLKGLGEKVEDKDFSHLAHQWRMSYRARRKKSSVGIY